MSIEMGSSNHKKTPWRTTINYLMQLFTSSPLPKWVFSTKLRIPVLAKMTAHHFRCSIGSSKGHAPTLSMYTYCANSGKFPTSTTLWSEYFNFSMQTKSVGMVYTPYGMCCSTMDASRFLRGDRTMGCLPFLLTNTIEVPTSACLCSVLESSYLVRSSTRTSYCYTDPASGCGLGVAASMCPLALPFIIWASSAHAGCCRFLASFVW
jgi:hypothetical protein